ncbi:MAG: sigma-54-dependent Fis family transcriptional regulator [Deltaproteobacteria bacterium]|nr:sigma-54-dependent Fis family transcriptional regulator [Deltaproteobacteria bacterium]
MCSHKSLNENYIRLDRENSGEPPGVTDKNRKYKSVDQRGYDFSNFIGSSASMKKVFEIIEKVAETKTTVLISGQSGTGKEMVARSIHSNSSRRREPFVAINCGAIPASLLESELFGHGRGAFSGANRIKKGLFEEAEKGTLFLDEVSELPLGLQVKILRAVQEKEIRRLGEGASRQVDLRIIAATNKSLDAEVKAGRFREDLFYRLNVIRLPLPSLRERIEDIPLLARHFLNQTVARNKLGPKQFSSDCMRALTNYHWPGNVRELINIIEQAAILSEGSIITTSDLPFGSTPIPENDIFVAIPEDRLDLKTTLKKVTALTEKILIKRILEQTGQNRTRAAKRLGISRRALITKLQNYNLVLEPSNGKGVR